MTEGEFIMYVQVFKRFIKRKTSIIGGLVLVLFFFMAIFGPMMCRYEPDQIDLVNKYKMPDEAHIFGTDNLGRDIFTRIVYGSRVTLLISFFGVIIGSFMGIVLGVSAGYFGGAVDALISRLIDLLLAFPALLLAIVVVAILGNGIINTIVAISIYSIPSIARMVRGIVLSIKNLEYIQACNVMGASDLRIIATHIVPNSVSQIIVNVTLSFGNAILTASSLSFLGLGVQPPNPEWGAMLNQGKDVIRSFPLAAIIPGVAITLVVLSFSLAGDGLRDALDPKLKNS